jgi:hypothetical protein
MMPPLCEQDEKDPKDIEIGLGINWDDFIMNVHANQLEKIFFTLKSIEKNTKHVKRQAKCAAFKMTLTYIGICFALLLSTTMLYILWIGFYPPSNMFHRIFFFDRLMDLKEFIHNLQNGTLYRAMIRGFLQEAMAQITEFNETSMKDVFLSSLK